MSAAGANARTPFWRKPQSLLALVSALGVVLVALVDIERTSPGALSAVHGRAEELEAGASCSACHGGLFSEMTESCLECHAAIEAQLGDGDGLHGVLGRDRIQNCALCHSEHHGAEFALVNAASFKLAGIDDPAAFDHVLVGFGMAGRHLELTCAECHVNAEAEVLPEGATRFLGLDGDCARCHDDPHEGRLVRGCQECHDQTDFDSHHSAEHEQVLELIGGHGGLACRTCHAEGAPHSLEALARGLRGRTPRACADCHASSHAPAFLDGVARLEGVAPEASCGACHLAAHTGFVADPAGGADGTGFAVTLTPRQHARSGFALERPHAELGCAECHPRAAQSFQEAYPGRRAEACSGCHDDPHAGQFEQGLFADEECTACHAAERFLPHAFDAELHGRTSLPLEGAHLAAECDACHVEPKDGGPRIFRGTLQRCDACHPDAHAGFFAERLAQQASPRARERGSCAECHLATSFTALPPSGFEHGRWTGFATVGAHAEARCEACHPRADEADATGRTFGRVRAHFGAVEDCASCHADPHQGRFDERPLPARLDGREGCLRCHVESSFRSLPHGFQHGRWTGFELDGAHSQADCAACHAPLRPPDAAGRTWKPAAGERCQACHADPHAGQFRALGKSTCERCHESAASWKTLDFDHDREARFRLGEAHAKVACSACHSAWELENGTEIVRYRPLDTSCASCHGSQEGPTLRRRGKRD